MSKHWNFVANRTILHVVVVAVYTYLYEDFDNKNICKLHWRDIYRLFLLAIFISFFYIFLEHDFVLRSTVYDKQLSLNIIK